MSQSFQNPSVVFFFFVCVVFFLKKFGLRMSFRPSLAGTLPGKALPRERAALHEAMWGTRAARLQPTEISSFSSQKRVRGKICQVPRCPGLWDGGRLFPTRLYLGEF